MINITMELGYVLNSIIEDIKLNAPDNPSKQPHEIVWAFQEAAKRINSGFINKDSSILVYNMKCWVDVPDSSLKIFLRYALEAYLNDPLAATEKKKLEDLIKQFPYSALERFPEQSMDKINFENGTLNLTDGKLYKHDRNDFFRYVLPYDYDPKAKCPMFEKYLSEVLPEREERMVIAEYIGYLFTSLKLEKVLFLYGAGLNGKSVLVDIIEALLGKENISHESLSDMCGDNGSNSRSNLVGKLLNTCSDVSAKAFQGDVFKRLASGEPISFKILYKDVNTSTDYAKQLFCLNELPRTSDTSNGYFRRFLIAPFPIQIPKEKINPKLASTIISSELPGIMNWVLQGRERLLKQNAFTESKAMTKALENYKSQYTTERKKGNSLLLPPFYNNV